MELGRGRLEGTGHHPLRTTFTHAKVTNIHQGVQYGCTTNALRIDIPHHCPRRVMTQGAQDRMLRVFREQPLAVRKLVEQHCSYNSCNDS